MVEVVRASHAIARERHAEFLTALERSEDIVVAGGTAPDSAPGNT